MNDAEISAFAAVCFLCEDSGFLGASTGYEGVCDECGGQAARAAR